MSDVTRLYITADEIEAALKWLGRPGNKAEADVMVAAQATADVLRGGRIEAAPAAPSSQSAPEIRQGESR